MKVSKSEDVLEAPNTKVAELQEKFDLMRQVLETKKYSIYLTKEQTEFLLNEFYQKVEWKGYESYAISETYNFIKEAVSKKGDINSKLPTEIVEAIFHFLKNFQGKGYQTAVSFRQLCDQFALPMKEINQDRQDLRDLSLELVAAEQGITVEQLNKNIEEGKM